MSLDAAKNFIAKMNNDTALKDKVANAIDNKSEQDAAATFVSLGKANGFDFTAEDAIMLRDNAIASISGEMSSAELDGVAGGRLALPSKQGASQAIHTIGGAVTGAANTAGRGITSAAHTVGGAFRNISSY